MTIPTSIIAIFCEDIREEKAGTVSLIGVLGDNVGVPAPPTPESTGLLPRLCVYIRINFDARKPIDPGVIKVRLPDGTELTAGSIDKETIEAASSTIKRGNPIAGVIMKLQLGNVLFKKLGLISIEIIFGNETHLAGTLNVLTEKDLTS